MDRVVAICEKNGVTLLEDCAHGCGVTWKGRQLGYHGMAASFSTQSDKVKKIGGKVLGRWYDLIIDLFFCKNGFFH